MTLSEAGINWNDLGVIDKQVNVNWIGMSVFIKYSG